MKLKELNLLQSVQESFIPIEMTMALDSLRNGDDNMSYKFILAQIVNYIKDHPITEERFREIYEFRPSLEMLEAVKEMGEKDLKELADWAHMVIDNAQRGIEQEGYMNPHQEVREFIKTVIKRNN